MLTLRDILAMRSPLRLAAMATVMLILQARPSLQQTYSTCNPTQQTCPPDTALGKSISFDFRSGSSSDFYTQGSPTFGSDGVSLTVAKSGDSPQLMSEWYIMFGHVEITLKAAPGVGIVSSSVLQSDDLDEIDWEWLGGATNQVQSNYFGKGQTTSYDRAAVHSVGSTTSFHKYTIDWTQDRVVWQIDGKTVRVLNANEAKGQYPQTPMQFKFGAWSGGDPTNAPGTIQWAGGSTDYSKGPFAMVVQSVAVTDYSTGTQYKYGDTSGTWSSITAIGGKVNGNSNGASGTDSSAPAITSTSPGNIVPFSGTHQSESAYTTPSVYPWVPQSTTLSSVVVSGTNYPGLPSGWTVNSSGKVVPPSAAPSTSPPALSSLSPAPSVAGYCSASGYELITSYNQQGFLATATVAVGVSIGWDDKGFPTTIFPSNCPTANRPIAAGQILKPSSLPDGQGATPGSGPIILTTTGTVLLPTESAGTLITGNRGTSKGSTTVRIAPASVLACLFALAFGLVVA